MIHVTIRHRAENLDPTRGSPLVAPAPAQPAPNLNYQPAPNYGDWDDDDWDDDWDDDYDDDWDDD